MSALHRGADDDGSVAITTALAVINILMVAAAALVAVADLSVTAARARATADAAALAGAAMSPLVSLAAGGAISTGGAADTAARNVAAANGGVIVDSDLRSWPLRYGVTVEVPPRTGWVRRFVGSLREASVAGVRPRVAEARP